MNVFKMAFEALRQRFDAIASPGITASNSTKLDATLKSIRILNESITLLNERMNAMAISLEGLAKEVDRIQAVSTGASEKIEALLTQVTLFAEEIEKAKEVASENSVDPVMLEELISKLRASTDALETTMKK